MKITAFVKRGVCIRFLQANSLQNEEYLLFQASRASRLSKATAFVKEGVCIRFHQVGSLQSEQSLLFRTFRASMLSKATAFVKRGVCISFHQAGNLENEQNLLFQTSRPSKPQFLSKDAFVYVFTKQAAYKMNKVCFFTLFVDKCCKIYRLMSYTFL